MQGQLPGLGFGSVLSGKRREITGKLFPDSRPDSRETG
jgi:hypothetical protein